MRLRAVRTDQAVLEHKVHHAVLQGVDACHERRAEQAVQRALPWPIDIGAKAESVPHAQANTDGDGTRHSRRGSAPCKGVHPADDAARALAEGFRMSLPESA